MKRIKIWLNSFNLVQQYICITFLAILIFALFVFKFLNNNINNFTNQQMYSYLHRSQGQYIESIEAGSKYDDTNAFNYMIALNDLNKVIIINEEIDKTIRKIDFNSVVDTKDGYIEDDDLIIDYSVTKYHNKLIISIIKNEYRAEFKSALLSGIVDSSLIVMSIVFVLVMAWVYSLIYPLNSIRNYIQKLRYGEQVELSIRRNDEIGEVAEAVVAMNEELSKQQRIREEMIQNISHDLKTPIATIKSYSESIKDGIYPYDTLEKSVDVIIEHANRLEKKVYSLITYNKVGYLGDTNEGDNLLMHPVIEKAILSCQVLRNDVNIDTDEVEYGIYFHGEEEAWRTVVENLLDNSLRYAKSKISIVLTDNLLEISNDGELMPKDRLEKLFKPYEKGTKGNFGLGLSIVKRVCDTYGYSVVGENKDDGVVFRIYRNKIKQKKK